ncbi:MAG: 3-hydroxyacyl-ACP dehydratase FabZ [Rickettsiaceae bacterium]|nr:3-hydroxyacyl-ACP dehydratase FabZ [Rickettsiaceae bacterium]
MQIEEEIITIGDIIKILPHRYPFLLVDKVLSYIPKSHIIGIKNVTINEPQFQGHFPQAPIMPGVLIIEAMAQLCGIFAFKEFDLQAQNKMVYLLGIDNAKFRKVVTAGDQLVMKASFLQARGSFFKFQVEAKVDNVLAAEALITATLQEK